MSPGVDELSGLCLSLPGAVEEFPFGDGVAVYKVAGKMFALVPLEASPPSISLKCDPALALHLRSSYRSVLPGYHLNKRHWNTVTVDGEVPPDELEEMVDHSYELVVASLTKAQRAALPTSADG